MALHRSLVLNAALVGLSALGGVCMPASGVCQEQDTQTARPSETPPQPPRPEQRNINRSANSLAPDPSNDDAINAAKAAQQLAEAQKAAADAQKARAEAELAAFKATVGEVPASGYNGNVELKNLAGTTESALLAAKAVQVAAMKIAAHLPKQSGKRTILLFPATELPSFQAYLTFSAQATMVETSLQNALQASANNSTSPPGSPAPVPAFVPIVGGAGVALAAVNNLLSYFRTDYSVGGISLSLDESLLVHALSGAIASSLAPTSTLFFPQRTTKELSAILARTCFSGSRTSWISKAKSKKLPLCKQLLPSHGLTPQLRPLLRLRRRFG